MIEGTLNGRAEVQTRSRDLGLAVVGAKVRTARNRFAVTRRKNPVRTSFHFGIAVPAVIAVVSLMTVALASGLSNVDSEIARTILAGVIAVASISAFIGSSTTALQALYLADDIPFLLTLPIPLRVLFGSKLVEASVGTLPSMMLFI